jgi:diguanylate cyclase (GGDEF)-like protein/PAS domain S-box-containing protein
MVINATFDAIWDWDLLTNEVIWNNGVNTLFSYSGNEVGLDANWWKEHIHPEDRKRVVSGIHAVIDSGRKEWLDEYRFHCGNGSYAYVIDRGFVIHDDTGKPVRMIGAMMDVSQRKLALNKLKESEEKYRSLVENINVGVYRNTVEGRFLHVNKAALKIFGYQDVNKLMNISALELYQYPGERALFLEDLMRQGYVKNKELRLINKEGKPIWVSCTSIVQYDKDGNIKWIDGVIEDITAQKEARQQIIVANKRLQYLLSSTTAVIYTAKPSDNYGATFVTENVKEMTGFPASNFVEKPDFWNTHIHPEDIKRALDDIQNVFKQLACCTEYRFKCKNGKYIWMRDEIKLVTDKEGNPLELIGYWVNITQRKQIEQKLKKINKQLLRSNLKLKQLALRDSHTGLYNHRYLSEVIESEFYRSKRYKQPLSVVMLDIDYFKSINDVYGHQFGDLVLKQFARLIKKVVRRYDIVIRYGGEEFIIISSGINRSAALALSERLLDAINLYNFGNKYHLVKLKLSLAVAAYPDDKVTKGMDLIELADQILNKVKEEGGNRVYSSMDIKKKKTSLSSNATSITNVRLLREKIDKLTKRSNQSLIEAVFAFARTIKLKDRYTGEHVERIVSYATEIARGLDLSKNEVELIRQASILHDLGKVGISDNILLKGSKLTRAEFMQIKKHPQIGVDIIRPIHFLHNIIPLILYHHERWDGKGYPEGLKQEEIPIGARVVAIADVYQALISDRPYRQAYTKGKAREMIKQGSGRQFDPRITSLFLKILKRV